MEVIIVRHAEIRNGGTDLSQSGGIDVARKLGKVLARYDITPSDPVAVGDFRAAWRTAQEGGFETWNTHVALGDERTISQTRNFTDNIQPELYMEQAKALTDSPPWERVWVADGGVVAALCKYLKFEVEKPVLSPCEILSVDL